MIDVLKLHENDKADWNTGEHLNSTHNIYEQRQINDIWALIFDYPMDDKARLITEGKICTCQGRKYEVVRSVRKMDKNDILSVTCRDLFSRRAKAKFIPTIPDKIGVKIKNLLSYVLTTYAGEFSLYSDAELATMGMEWVSDDYRIDFFTVDKTNLWDFLHTVIDNLGRGEIYSDGYKFAIVERIGQDRGVRLSLYKNMENIQIERSTEDIITRLWSFGADDMTVSSVNGGKAYIDSPNIDLYGVHEGYRDYSDYTDPNKILANAQWEFAPDNEDRIDIPKLTITGKVIDLSKLEEYGDLEKIELGDTVHVIDVDGTEYTERVIEGIWYPYEAKQTTLSIGHMRRDVFFTLYQLQHSKMDLEAVQTTGKQLRTRSLAGVVNSTRNNVQSDNELLKIVGDLLTIYGDVSGKKQKRLELGNVDGEFALNIYDSDEKKGKNRLKIKLGDHGDDYAFAIYNDKGNAAIYMDENGEIIISGRISTGKNAEVGTNLVVGKSSASGRIDFAGMINQAEGSISVADHEMDINANYVRINGRDILKEIDMLKDALSE